MALIIFLALTIAIAYLEAFEDAQKIAANKSINHRDELIERCMAVACAGLLLFGVFGLWQWRALLWMPIAWSVFTPSFRYLLNRMRGKDWRYVSPSNVYDRLFMRLGNAADDHAELMRFYVLWEAYRRPGFRWAGKLVHRAGAIAYAFEFAVLLASLILYACAG